MSLHEVRYVLAVFYIHAKTKDLCLYVKTVVLDCVTYVLSLIIRAFAKCDS